MRYLILLVIVLFYSCGKSDLSVEGCTDPTALNYNSDADIDDGSCIYVGCTDSNAWNYDPLVTVEDNTSCLYIVCSDPDAINYFCNESEGNCQPSFDEFGVPILDENGAPIFALPFGFVDDGSKQIGRTSKLAVGLQLTVAISVVEEFVQPLLSVTVRFTS